MNTPFDEEPHRGPGLFSRLRASFLTGIVVIAPVWLTIWLIWSVVGWIDSAVLPLIPQQFQESLVYLRTAVSVDPKGWAKFGYVKMPEYRWGVLLAPQIEDRRIPCGEHAGDPAAIAFCRAAGFDYVSCSPFRVPVARLAAAQLAISDKIGDGAAE